MMHDVRMDLIDRRKRELSCLQGGEKFAAIFEDILAGVPFGEAEIQHLFPVEGADSTGAGAERVDQPGKFQKGSALQNLQAFRVANYPGIGQLARG